MKKHKKNALIEAHRQTKMIKVMIIIALCLVFSASVAAYDFDNVRDYDEATRTITITNALGLGDDIATVQVLTQKHNLVLAGEDRLVAEIKINSFSDYENALKEMEFYDYYSMDKQDERSFKYKIKTIIGSRDVNDYKEVCSTQVNGTYVCYNKIIGTHKEDIYDWIDYSVKDILTGEFILGVFTDVIDKERVEWIPTFFGERMTEFDDFTGYIKYEFYEIGDDSNSACYDTVWYGMQFTIGTTGINEASTLGGVAIRAYRQGTLSNLNATVYTVSGGNPATPLSQNATMNVNWLTDGATGEWINITMPATSLSASIQYILVISGYEPAAFIRWKRDSDLSGGGYSGGSGRSTVDSGTTWGVGEDDFMFQIYGEGIVKHNIAVTLDAPIDDSGSTATSWNFGASLTPDGLINATNATIFVWYDNSTLFNSTFNTVNGPTTNVSNWTISGFPIGTYDWNVFGCGIDITNDIHNCTFASANYTFSRQPFEIDGEYYKTHVYETGRQYFYVNLTTEEDVLSTSIDLNYNGTEYFVETNCLEGFCELVKGIDIPLINASIQENKTFFWELKLFAVDGSVSFFNTTKNIQSVNAIFLGPANTTFQNITANFTTWDEQNRTSINPMKFSGTFNYWLGLGDVKKTKSFGNLTSNLIQLAIYPDNQTFKTDATIEYNVGGAYNATYETRNYHFQNASLTNATQNIKLFLLNKESSTSFIQKVIDTSQLAISNALVFAQRYYPEDDSYETVSITKTDSYGESAGFYEIEVPYYRHLITKNGELLKITELGKIFPQSVPYTITFTIGKVIDNAWTYFEGISNLVSTLIYDETLKIVKYTWIDTTGALSIANLTVEKTYVNQSNIIICSSTSTLTAGTLSCDVSEQNGTLVAKGYIGRSPEVLDKLIIFTISTIKQVFAEPFLLLWIIFLIAMIGVGLFYPPAGIVLISVVMVLGSTLGLISVGWIFIWAIIAVGIWVMIETSN